MTKYSDIIPLFSRAKRSGSGVGYTFIVEFGRGAKITLHYEGFLKVGTKLDSSRDRGEPWSVVFASMQLIKSWYLRLLGMKECGKRTLLVRSEPACGERSVGKC